MAGQQRVYNQRIKSTETLRKMFRAMELIAASRITKARERAGQAAPYATAITRAVSAVATHANVEHRLTTDRNDTKRVAMLVVTSDRGMAGAYSATVLREAERLRGSLRAEGKEVALYVAGRRGVGFYTFRGVEIVQAWGAAARRAPSAGFPPPSPGRWAQEGGSRPARSRPPTGRP